MFYQILYRFQEISMEKSRRDFNRRGIECISTQKRDLDESKGISKVFERLRKTKRISMYPKGPRWTHNQTEGISMDSSQ